MNLRVGAVCSYALARALVRRRRSGARHPSWSYETELLHELLRAAVDHAFRSLTLDERRVLSRGGGNWRSPRGLDWTVATIADLPMEQHTPTSWTPADLVWLHWHGGAYVMGSPATYRKLAARIALSCGVRVILPEYRKAPEHPYPAAIDDALAVYRAMLASGLSPAQIVLGGDSAGGGLALALAQTLRTLVLPQPRAIVLLSPWVDMTAHGSSAETNRAYDYLHGEMLSWAAAMYLNGADPHEPLVSPVLGDLRGLPPLLVQSGGSEILLSQGITLVERARAAGVDVQHEISEGMVHVFQLFDRFEASQEAYRSIRRFVRSLHR